MGCPQGSCSGPGIAFADDLVIATKWTTVLEAQTLSNVDLQKIKILNWAKNSKMEFNDQKSKAILITRKRRPDKTNISIHLNNKHIK